MGRASKAHGALHCTPLALALSLSLVGSGAVAADLKSVDGLLQFENVHVVTAPAAASPQATPQGGMRAYKDSADSPLRGPSTEEMAASAATSAVGARRASASDAAAPVRTFAAPGGGIGAVLDDSFMQYSVVVRQPDGTLGEVCVTGSAEAEALVAKSPVPKSAAPKETPNDR